MKLKGRTALITGAGRGIGRAIAESFAREGADLILTARTGSELDEVKAACAPSGVKVTPITADLAQPDAVARLVAALPPGRIDILVNNAGIGSSSNPRPLVSFDDSFWALTLQINLTAPYLLCKAVLPGMIAARFGRIINIASINGKIGALHGAAYAASKHGLLGLTKSIAMETVKDGITANSICPGVVASRMNNGRIAYDARRLGKTTEEIEAISTPLGRRMTPDEISPLAVFLASDEARAINGQAYNVDCGTVMT